MAKYLILGATGGIGEAIAETLHASGHDLHLSGRNADKLAALSGRLGASHTVGDVMEAGAIETIVAEAGDDLAGLVYAIGTINLKPLSKMTMADFSNDFNLNAASAAKAIQAALLASKTK
ncbi:MAG: SDR family oxidoreductase [Ahrensia sp.]|nr:SDR family oxidoreductase [Ahrensia sp.]